MSVLESFESVSSVRQPDVGRVDFSRLDDIERQMDAAVRELFPSYFTEEEAPATELIEPTNESVTDSPATELDQPVSVETKPKSAEKSSLETEDNHQDKPKTRLSRLRAGLSRIALGRRPEKDHETKWQRRRRRIMRGMGVAATATAAAGLIYLYSSANGGMNGTEYAMVPSTTSLDTAAHGTDIMIGGRLDGTSQGIDAMYGGALRDNPDKILINYPAGIAPLDSTSWNESINIGASNAVEQAVATGNPDGVHIFGHSEGSTAAVEAANRLNDMGYSPELTITGSPETGVSGFFYDPIAEAGKPLFEALDIDTTPKPLPEGTTVYGKPGDFWANSGGRPAQTQVGQLLGTFLGDTHAYTADDLTNPANTSFVGHDGVEYVTVDDQLSGYGNAATANGFEWSPQAEAFVDSIAPEGEIGKPAPAPDLNKAIQTGTNLAIDSINRALPPEVPKIAEVPVFDTPAAPAPAPVYESAPAPVYEPAPAPVYEPAPAPVAPIPAPVEVAPQISNTINDVATQVQNVVGNNTPEAQVVNDIANQANDLVNSFLPR